MTIAALKALCSRIRWCEPAVLESVLELALEIAREGCAERPAPLNGCCGGITGWNVWLELSERHQFCW
jgi:hypothetical protein